MSVQKLPVLSLAIPLLLLGCGKSVTFKGPLEQFLSDSSSTTATPPSVPKVELLIEDYFERDRVFPDGDGGNNFGWRSFIDDVGNPYVGDDNGHHVAAKIFSFLDGELGPPANMDHGDRYLVFYGRDGSSIHTIFLISRAFDLSEFHSLQVSFKYLPIDLNDPQSPHEYLRFEVCTQSVETCGVGENLEIGGIESDAWQTIFEHDPADDQNGLNGRNHTPQHWRNAEFDVDLDQFSMSKSEFVFRFTAHMDEGFIDDDLSEDMEDGIGLDDIKIYASEGQASGGCQIGCE